MLINYLSFHIPSSSFYRGLLGFLGPSDHFPLLLIAIGSLKLNLDPPRVLAGNKYLQSALILLQEGGGAFNAEVKGIGMVERAVYVTEIVGVVGCD